MDERQNNALDFLLYSYCSVSFSDLGEEVTDKVLGLLVDRAYKDASSHVLSATPLLAKNPKEKAKENIANKIKELKNNKGDYDKWHDQLCKDIIDTYTNDCSESTMSYGIAQKWVNMTMKNLMVVCDVACVTDAANSKFVEEYGPLIEEYRKQFHVPVDSYIIDKSWLLKQENGVFVNLPLKDDNIKRNKEYKTPSSYVKAWSKWDDKEIQDTNKNEYQLFQESLRKALKESPIDWEGPAWIEQAKKRNRKTD